MLSLSDYKSSFIKFVVAASVGAKEICRVLIDAGAPVEIKGIRNAYGNTCLHSAVRAGSVEIVRLFLEKGADVNATNNLGSTPLHMCAFLATNENNKDNKSDVIEIANCSKYPIGNETIQIGGYRSTLRQESVLSINPYLQIAAILISSGKVREIDATDNNGYSALHIAAQQGYIDMVTLLVDSGASLTRKSSVDYKGRGGRTAVNIAKSAGKIEAFECLSQMERVAAEEGGVKKLVTHSVALSFAE